MKMYPLRSVAVIALILLTFFTSCSQPSVCTLAQPHLRYTHAENYGNGAVIDPAVFDSLSLRPGDGATLQFSCPPVLASAPAGWTVTINGNDALIQHQAPPTPLPGASPVLAIEFSEPAYTFYVQTSDLVWPGDANRDGKRSMLDLFPIASGIFDPGVFRIHGSAWAQPLQWPPVPAQVNPTYGVDAWGYDFLWDGNAIDYKHADCNLDNDIDTIDADYLMSCIRPMYLPEYLKDQVAQFELNAIPTGLVEPPFILPSSGGGAPRLGIRLHYGIHLSSTTPHDVFGVIFSRPVSESPAYSVDTINAYLQNSDLFNNGSAQKLIRQRYWDEVIAYPDAGPCIPGETKTIDVGAFNTEGFVTLPPNGRIINCGVTLEDILTPANGTGTVPVIQHIYNGIVFCPDANGNPVPVTASCTTDQTQVNLAEYCPTELAIRDGDYDTGSPVNTDDARAWVSPDIWFTEGQNTEHISFPKSGQELSLWARVTNFNCTVAENITVDFYWMMATTNEQWNSGSMMNHIGQTHINDIAAWGHDSASVNWTVPDLASMALPSFQGAQYPIVSLIAVVKGPGASPNTNQLGNVRGFMLGSNDVAMRSFIPLQDAELNQGATWATLIGKSTAPQKQVLHIEQVEGPLHHPATRYGRLRLNLNAVPIDQLGAADNLGKDATSHYVANGSSEATIALNIAAGEEYPIGLRFEQGSNHPAAPVRYRYRVWVTSGPLTNPQILNSSVVEFTAQ